MYYEPKLANHGLPHDPFKALVAPRPIGWVSTVDASGVCNLAPYSFFNAVRTRPPYVMFSSESRKDSVRNIEQTGEFVCSLATWDLRDQMNVTSAPVPAGDDEFPLAGLTAARSTSVKPPRVKESPAAFECVLWKIVEIPPEDDAGDSSFIVFGRVVGVHIDDRFIKDGLVNTGEMRPIARMGYMEYAVVSPESVFTLNRPELDDGGQLKARAATAWDGKYR